MKQHPESRAKDRCAAPGTGWRRIARAMVGVVLSLAVLVGMPYGQVPRVAAQTDACPEPNDDLTSACSLTVDTVVHAYISGPDDVDTFRFTVTSGGQVQIDLTDMPADYDLYLADR